MEDMKNKVLLRQLKKSKIKSFEDLDEKKFMKLLSFVERTYDDMDNNFYRLERALEISTTELIDLNENLEKKVDIELEKNIEKDKKIMTQSRSASMGEMIGNIAHQWRQPLSAISSTSSGMRVQHELGVASHDEIRDSYDNILEYTNFLTQTIEVFRDFFKNDKEITTFDIVDYMDKTIRIIESTYKNYGIEIIHQTTQKEYLSNGFPNELTQVFINILNNAKDILIEKDLEIKRVEITYSEDRRYNIISILDNGGGIPERIMERIFDPYFTTKHKAQGTGIGLYMCRQIVQKHLRGGINIRNDFISIDGKMYKGACFRLYIPKI